MFFVIILNVLLQFLFVKFEVETNFLRTIPLVWEFSIASIFYLFSYESCRINRQKFLSIYGELAILIPENNLEKWKKL